MFNFFLSRLAMAAAAVVVLASPAAAQTNTAPSPSPTAGSTARAQVAREDTAFLKQAAQNGHAEIEGSKLAETKAANDKVKSFAKQTIDDHTKTSAELSALAASKGVEVSAEPSVAQKAKIKALDMADGAKFDTRYVNELGVKATKIPSSCSRRPPAAPRTPRSRHGPPRPCPR